MRGKDELLASCTETRSGSQSAMVRRRVEGFRPAMFFWRSTAVARLRARDPTPQHTPTKQLTHRSRHTHTHNTKTHKLAINTELAHAHYLSAHRQEVLITCTGALTGDVLASLRHCAAGRPKREVICQYSGQPLRIPWTTLAIVDVV